MWTPSNLEKERLLKLAHLREEGVEPYPRRALRTHTTAQAISAYQSNVNDSEMIEVTVAGRIRRLNLKGKIAFLHIEDEHGRLQLFLRINNMDEDEFLLVKNKLVEIDDFVQASGTMMETQAGEISVLVHEFKLLAKTISPLPVIKSVEKDDGEFEAYGEFSNIETRYRQRYVDLAVNKHVREIFLRRTKIIRAMQNFLDDEGMLEVETPILQPIYGGAAARPFTTHHNQLHQDLFLRISFELYLKRLLVGGFDAVYEIGRDFRNEGVSKKHNPEFTMMEFYKAYIDYQGVMDIVERMTASIAEQVAGTTVIRYQGHEVDLTPPWKRMTIQEAVQVHPGIDYMDYPDAESLAEVLKAKFNRSTSTGDSWGRLVVENLLGDFVEPNLIQPTFIINYPRDVSPFAKPTENFPNHTERFELFIAGMEMGNAFTELNDPEDQAMRFAEMAELYRQGTDEETPLDEDYLRAMRYGMPPMGGFGMGVDRLVMLLTDQPNIREVLLFPHLRSDV